MSESSGITGMRKEDLLWKFLSAVALPLLLWGVTIEVRVRNLDAQIEIEKAGHISCQEGVRYVKAIGERLPIIEKKVEDVVSGFKSLKSNSPE